MSDELFTPSLKQYEREEVFDRPWNPTHIVFVAFFGGLAAAAILHTLNWRRLGCGGRTRLSAVILGVLVVVIGVGLSLLQAQSVGGVTSGNLRMINRVLSVVVAWIVAGMQNDQYSLAQKMDVDMGRLWVPGALAFLAGIVIQAILVFFVRAF